MHYLSTNLADNLNEIDQIRDTLSYLIKVHPLSIPGIQVGIAYSEFDMSDERTPNAIRNQLSSAISKIGLVGVGVEKVDITNNQIVFTFSYKESTITLGV